MSTKKSERVPRQRARRKPDITDVLHDSMAVHNHADAPDEKAQRSPLLPNRWRDHAGVAMEAQRQQPILVVSHQVAEVVNMGIDRVVDIAARTKEQLQATEAQFQHYRREYEWLREFMRNVRDRIGPVRDEETIIPEGGPQHFLEDLARSIDLLEKGLPA